MQEYTAFKTVNFTFKHKNWTEILLVLANHISESLWNYRCYLSHSSISFIFSGSLSSFMHSVPIIQVLIVLDLYSFSFS